MSDVNETVQQEQKTNDEQVSSFQPAPPDPNGQMGQGQQYTKDELNVIMNLIHNCTIKGQDAPLMMALGTNATTMTRDLAY